MTPTVTTDVLLIQHELGFRKLVGLVDQLTRALSNSTAIVDVSDALVGQLGRRPRLRCPMSTTATSASTRRSRTG